MHSNNKHLLSSANLVSKRKKSNDATTSVQAVFTTYELIEGILKLLSTEDLRTARLVSQHWKLLISESHRLNQTWQIRDRYFSLVLFGNIGVDRETFAANVGIPNSNLSVIDIHSGFYSGMEHSRIWVTSRVVEDMSLLKTGCGLSI